MMIIAVIEIVSVIAVTFLVIPVWILYRLTKWIPVVGSFTKWIYMIIEFVRIFGTHPWSREAGYRVWDMTHYAKIESDQAISSMQSSALPFSPQGIYQHIADVGEFFGFPAW